MKNLKDLIDDLGEPTGFIDFRDDTTHGFGPGQADSLVVLWGLKNDFRPASPVKKFDKDQIKDLEAKMKKGGKL